MSAEPLRVTLVGYRRALGTSLTIPMEMLHAADMIQRISGMERPLAMRLANLDGGDSLQLTAGLEWVCRDRLEDLPAPQLAILPAMWGNPAGVAARYPALLDWLRERQRAGTLLCAVGTGSFFLAEAGLLDGRAATTHWYYFDRFAARYPQVQLHRERFITRAGNLLCAGSVNSVRDVMLSFIEERWSPRVAHQVARHFTHELQRSYSARLLHGAPQDQHAHESIIAIQEWMQERFATEISMDRLAADFGMSVRTLNRHFRAATGRTPLQYLQQLRIDNAKELLKASNLSIAEVAFRVGYPDSSYFSALFKKSISLSPKDYRRLVRKKLFTVGS